MRYLRMLTNAVAGGVLMATYLVILVLQLNPQVPIASLTVVRWLRTLIALYGLYFSVAIMLLILLREAVASRPLHPGWLSLRLSAWLSAAGCLGATIITWANLTGFSADLGEAAAERMRQGAIATTIAAVVLLLIAAIRYSVPHKGRPLAAVGLMATISASVVVPIGLRGPGEPTLPAVRTKEPLPAIVTDRAAPHVRLLLLDGASYGFILERVAAGQLPNFGRVLDRGAHLLLATLKPTEAVPVWAAAVTGKYPPRNGVRSDAVYRIERDDEDPVTLLPDYCFARSLVLQDFVLEDKLTASALRARSFWDIASDYGIVPGIVNVPLTRPAHAALGFVVSDTLDEAFSPLRLSDEGAGDPTTAIAAAREVFDGWLARPWTDAVPASAPNEPQPAGYQHALWDHAYSETLRELELPFAPRLTAVRYEGLNVFGEYYLEQAEPEQFGRLAGPDRFQSVLDRYYAYIDAELGRALNALDPASNDLVIVMSGFGMERMPPMKRLLARLLARSDPSGAHENAPDGFLLAFGPNVGRGSFTRGAIVDLAPTVLYYLGLPVGRDMDGFPRTDLFRASYTLEHPVTYLRTYEKAAGR